MRARWHAGESLKPFSADAILVDQIYDENAEKGVKSRDLICVDSAKVR